ncbi:methylenetetrahydrofolate reductase, partial [Paracoccus sp. PXZ]
IDEVKEIAGVAGIHVMAYRQEEYVAEIVHESGILKGRKPWRPEPRADDALVVGRLDRILHDPRPETPQQILREAQAAPQPAKTIP